MGNLAADDFGTRGEPWAIKRTRLGWVGARGSEREGLARWRSDVGAGCHAGASERQWSGCCVGQSWKPSDANWGHGSDADRLGSWPPFCPTQAQATSRVISSVSGKPYGLARCSSRSIMALPNGLASTRMQGLPASRPWGRSARACGSILTGSPRRSPAPRRCAAITVRSTSPITSRRNWPSPASRVRPPSSAPRKAMAVPSGSSPP